MSSKEPVATFDVDIHNDGYIYVYRVGFLKELTEEWMAEWRTMFYDVHDMAGHAAHLANVVRDNRLATFVEGYGPAGWLDEMSWRTIAVWNKDGEEVSRVVMKRMDASIPTEKYDYTTVSQVDWEGFDARINR